MFDNPIPERQLRPPAPGSGLLGVVPTLTVGADGLVAGDGLADRWQGGVSWLPEGYRVSGVAGYGLCTGVARSAEGLEAGETQTAVPFDVWAEDRCGTVDQSRDRWGRARRALDADLSFHVAAEFERGAIAQGDGLPNAYLTDGQATEIVLGSTAFASVFPMLDGALTRALRNRQGVVHCAPEHLAAMAELDLVRWAASVPLTPNGHVIAADGGYQSEAQAEGGSTIFATDMPTVILGPVQTDPPTPTDEYRSSIDVETNDQLVRAYRSVVVQWDRSVHLSVETDVAVALPEFTTPGS